MTELSRESRALLEAARGREGLSAAEKERIRGKLSRRIGAGLAFGSAMTTSVAVAEAAHSTAWAAVTTWLPAAAKVLSVVAIASGVTVGAMKVARQPAPSSVHASSQSVSPRGVQSKPERVQLETAVVQPLVAAGEASEPKVAVAPLSTSAKLAKVSEPSAAIARTPPEQSPEPVDDKHADDGLKNQVAAIREARLAIRRGDGNAALSALDGAFVQGQGGPLEQEATMARVSALCLLGDRASARRVADQFSSRYPASVLVG